MPPALPGNLQLIPSASNSNLYPMTSPSEGDQSPAAAGLSMIQQQMMPNVNPNTVNPYVAGGATAGPRYAYTR